MLASFCPPKAETGKNKFSPALKFGAGGFGDGENEKVLLN
jgi:hypothetical protein